MNDPVATELLSLYFAEMVGRYHGRAAGEDEVERSMAEDPSDGLVPPHGLFLVARRDGVPVGCAGLKRIDPHLGEIKRMFVSPDSRGLGGGGRLLAAVEEEARRWGIATLRLDTRHDLVEARGLYAKHGYSEVPPHSRTSRAEHWFAKQLPPSGMNLF